MHVKDAFSRPPLERAKSRTHSAHRRASRERHWQPTRAALLPLENPSSLVKRAAVRFRNLKWGIMIVTLGIYYLTPWIRWDRGPNLPDQAVLVDMANRRFFFFWIEIWPHEFYFRCRAADHGRDSGLFLFTSALWDVSGADTRARKRCGRICSSSLNAGLKATGTHVLRLHRQEEDGMPERSYASGTNEISSPGSLIAVATGGAWVFYFTDAPTLLSRTAGHRYGSPRVLYVGRCADIRRHWSSAASCASRCVSICAPGLGSRPP